MQVVLDYLAHIIMEGLKNEKRTSMYGISKIYISISRYLDYILLLWIQEFEYLYASFYLNI